MLTAPNGSLNRNITIIKRKRILTPKGNVHCRCKLVLVRVGVSTIVPFGVTAVPFGVDVRFEVIGCSCLNFARIDTWSNVEVTHHGSDFSYAIWVSGAPIRCQSVISMWYLPVCFVLVSVPIVSQIPKSPPGLVHSPLSSTTWNWVTPVFFTVHVL